MEGNYMKRKKNETKQKGEITRDVGVKYPKTGILLKRREKRTNETSLCKFQVFECHDVSRSLTPFFLNISEKQRTIAGPGRHLKR